MTKEQEAQQAQTIAHIRKNQNTGNDLCREDDFIAALLKIVDSQSQKIAEQAKEIERMDACMFQHMPSETYNHCQEYLEKMRGNNEKAN